MRGNEICILESAEEVHFLDGIRELYATIEADQTVVVRRKMVTNRRVKSYLVRLLMAFPLLFNLRLKFGNQKKINFSAMIAGDFGLLIPNVFFSRMNFIYMHDAWPRFQHWIFPLLDFFNVKHVFFSSKQVWMDHLKRFPNSRCQSMWLPEGIDSAEYRYRDFLDKDIDVLEFGRRYEAYHLLIKEQLFAAGKKHIYSRESNQVLFPQKHDLIEALASAKIVVCVPSNITHPARAEYISSMTLRYLQSMASKCLIVGIMPSDMHELFDYSPIIEIDMERPAAQLLAVLENYTSYLPLIEKNFQAVSQHHQWANRWAVMKAKMEEMT